MPIIKILSRHSASYSSMIKYLLKEGKGEDGQSPEPILHNLRGSNIQEWTREFYINEAMRKVFRKDQVLFFHNIISFGAADAQHISPEMMQEAAQKFIELRGKDGMHIAAIHHDKSHAHIHCMTSALKFRSGESMRLSKEKLKELKISYQRDWQQALHPELVNSLPKHGRGGPTLSHKEYAAQKRSQKSIKAKLSQKVNNIFNRANSQQHFLQLLQESGLHHYERGGRAYGITLDDRNYRFNTLGVSIDDMEQKTEDRSEEEQALQEIEDIRKSINQERDQEIENDEPHI